jgi:hypothetical protein
MKTAAEDERQPLGERAERGRLRGGRGAPPGADRQRVRVGEARGERETGDALRRLPGPGEPLAGRARHLRQVRDQVEVVRRALQDVRGEVVGHGEDLVAGADPQARAGPAARPAAEPTSSRWNLSGHGSWYAAASRTVSASSGSSPLGGVAETYQ